MTSSYKDTQDILELIKKAQNGDKNAENKLVVHYEPYVNYMVSRYSKKTNIKDDDDLRSYIYIGLLEGIRRFDPEKNTRFIYFAHIWMKKNIFLGEVKYRFIKVPVNQKVFYEKFLKEHEELDKQINYELDNKEIKNYLTIENTKTISFSDLSTLNDEADFYELPESVLFHKNIDNFKIERKEETLDILKQNINKALANFSEKEVYIIENLFGLNGMEIISSENLAKELKVSKVHINVIKTRVIRLLRHSSFYSILFKGI